MQEISIYPGALIELNDIELLIDAKCIFLITGKKSFELSGAKAEVFKYIENKRVVHYDDFDVNPNLEDVCKGITIFNQNNCDLIVSIGGGSVIDTAKLINYYKNVDFSSINRLNLINDNFIPTKHICIPTTAGSGSESTHFAVMYIENDKYSIANTNLLPHKIIIDPILLRSQTKYQLAVSGVDALAQAIESFWSINSTVVSRRYSEKALELVWKYLPVVINNPVDYSYLMLSIGANLAGRAINITKTTAAHALSYSITKNIGLPHGHAVALSLPYFYREHHFVNEQNCNDKRGVQYVKEIMNKINSILNYNYINEEVLLVFFKNINLEINVKNLNIERKLFPMLIGSINKERLANNPIILDESKLIKYFEEQY